MTMWQRLLRSALFALVIGIMPARAAGPADPAAFIADLGKEAIQILQAHEDSAARKAAFSKLFTADFDVPAIGKFVLGRYWRAATPAEQAQYIQVFGKYVVAIYASRFSSYSGEEFKVLGSHADDANTSIVTSQIIRPSGGPPYSIEWQVAKEGDGYKITNVIVENVSMALTQRQEFASVIEQNGGSVAALISMLQQKVQDS